MLKDRLKFQKDFTLWALDRGISWKDPIILQKILSSGLKPESVSPPEFFGMLADPSLGLCDPELIGKVFDVSKQNLTREDLQVSFYMQIVLYSLFNNIFYFNLNNIKIDNINIHLITSIDFKILNFNLIFDIIFYVRFHIF